MNPIHILLGVSFIGLALIWPLAFFGYKYFRDTTHAEMEKHAKHGSH